MLFKPEHIGLIQKGWKTVSRRMWSKPRVKVGSHHQIKTKIFTKEHFGYVRIDRIYRERLSELTEQHAAREGNYTKHEYLKLFKELYPDAGDYPMPWVVEFTYVGMEVPECR